MNRAKRVVPKRVQTRWGREKKEGGREVRKEVKTKEENTAMEMHFV